jgi:hypothetical protein
VAHALASGRERTAHRVVALLSLHANHAPVFEVLDWVRPFPPDHEWTAESAVCASAGQAVDVQRCLGPVGVRSRDDLPAWFDVASAGARATFVAYHLISGGDWRLAIELLDEVAPTSDYHRATVEGSRLYAHFTRRTGSPGDEPDLDELVSCAAQAVAIARRSGSAITLAYTASMAAYALSWGRPELASAYAREAADIADRLGAEYLSGLAESALGAALSSSLAVDVLVGLRDRARVAVAKKQFHSAGLLAWSATTAIVPSAPHTAFRLWAVWRRDFGGDMRGYLDDAALVLPADLGALEQEVVGVTIADAIGEVVAALERVIAAAPAEVVGAAGGGG